MTFALIGNQNCGKTTLFNALTGSNQHVGNFPGVTVEKKEGEIRRKKGVSVVDLPGIYSLSPYTSEEIVTRDFLLKEKPDGIINIVDATNLERNLYLSLQLMELRIPTVIALNMMDEVEENHQSIDLPGLRAALGVPVVPISASKEEGVAELVDVAVRTASNKVLPEKLDFCGGAVHKAVHSVAHLIEQRAVEKGVPKRYAATKLIEGDAPTEEQFDLSDEDKHIIGEIVSEMERTLGTDREAALADMRYAYIDNVVRTNVKKGEETIGQKRSVALDKVLTHRYFAIPIFLLVMLLIFWLTFGVIGEALSSVMEGLIGVASAGMDALLTRLGASELLHSLLIDGIFAGVGSVLSFLPTILVLFFFLSVLEDTGYMARVAFVMDKLLRKIGLSGRSFVPMIIGFGCSVPAVMATRTLASDRDRKMTILLVPFMSCSAKLPIYAMITDVFFQKNKALVMVSLYVLGMVVGILYGLLFKNTVFRSEPMPFVMELPSYRFPSPRSVLLHMLERAKDFLRKAFTVILGATVAIWFLQRYDLGLNVVTDGAASMLGTLGRWVAPVFAPLGFGDWRLSTALITGLTAKEAVVSTLTVLMGAGDKAALSAALAGLLSPLAAYTFLVFTLLYMPCVAAFAAVRREFGSTWQAAVAMATQTCIAWLVAFIVYNVGALLV
ncbi:MAG: ferrous iron transport protein B [Oscillospiraceae bacterium]|nr:ferrous iron transport protein B [Oscillospiraceae bacterium]